MTLCFSLKSFGFFQSARITGTSQHIALLFEHRCFGGCLFRVPIKGPDLA